MTRKTTSVEELRSKGFQAINDFSLEQCVRAIKRDDAFDMSNNGAYIRVRFTAPDGIASGDMMRRVTELEYTEFMKERKKNTFQVQRKERPDWKQDD